MLSQLNNKKKNRHKDYILEHEGNLNINMEDF